MCDRRWWLVAAVAQAQELHTPPPCLSPAPCSGGRLASHIPTSSVLAKPFMSGGGGGRGGGARGGVPSSGGRGGGNLSTRFDYMAGAVPSGPARPTGQPRRNAHGVVLP